MTITPEEVAGFSAKFAIKYSAYLGTIKIDQESESKTEEDLGLPELLSILEKDYNEKRALLC